VTARRNRSINAAVVLALAAVLSVPAAPATAAGGSSDQFPAVIALPDGFRPEGVAIGGAPYAYFGSLADGSIYRADLRTGAGQVVSQGPGTPSVGLALDHRGRLFVAGGPAGNARVVDVATGDIVAAYQLATDPSFINDVTLAAGAAWFTDSLAAVLYRVPLGPGGSLPPAGAVSALPLTGDFQLVPGFNLNGITATPDRSGLLVVQSATGLLFRVDPAGVTTAVDLGGETLPAGDGMLLRGTTLYVVQNQLNQVAVVHLDPSGTSGTVVARVGDPSFDVPTTVAAFGDRLYLPNARFTTPPEPDTPYTAVGILIR
jgi:sugar lactone lactonase YvrE